MPYPKDFCKCDVIGETAALQVLQYHSVWYCVHLRTGYHVEIKVAVRDCEIVDARYRFNEKDIAMVRQAKQVIDDEAKLPARYARAMDEDHEALF